MSSSQSSLPPPASQPRDVIASELKKARRQRAAQLKAARDAAKGYVGSAPGKRTRRIQTTADGVTKAADPPNFVPAHSTLSSASNVGGVVVHRLPARSPRQDKAPAASSQTILEFPSDSDPEDNSYIPSSEESFYSVDSDHRERRGVTYAEPAASEVKDVGYSSQGDDASAAAAEILRAEAAEVSAVAPARLIKMIREDINKMYTSIFKAGRQRLACRAFFPSTSQALTRPIRQLR